MKLVLSWFIFLVTDSSLYLSGVVTFRPLCYFYQVFSLEVKTIKKVHFPGRDRVVRVEERKESDWSLEFNFWILTCRIRGGFGSERSLNWRVSFGRKMKQVRRSRNIHVDMVGVYLVWRILVEVVITPSLNQRVNRTRKRNKELNKSWTRFFPYDK